MRNMLGLLIAIGVLICVAVGCGDVKDAKPLADGGVVEFHSRLNEAKYDEIYLSASDGFRNASSKEELVKLLSSVRSKLGQAVDSKTETWKVGNFNLTTTVTLGQKTRFEHGEADERFVFVILDRRPLLHSYHINSMDLITK